MKSPKKQSATLKYDPLSVKYLQANVSFDMPTIAALKDFYLKSRTLHCVKSDESAAARIKYINIQSLDGRLLFACISLYKPAPHDGWTVSAIGDQSGKKFKTLSAAKAYVCEEALKQNWILK